jgi:hypothetical protein
VWRLLRSLNVGAACMAAVVLGGCGAGAPASRLGSLRSPAHILAQTAAALDRVHSFHLQGTGMDAGGLPVTFSGDFSIPGRLALTISENGQTFALKLVGGDAYLRANAQYWVAAGSTANAVALLADRWVKVPVASAPGLAQFRALTEPSTLGRCAIESGLGTVTVGGNTVIDGVPAVVLIDHGATCQAPRPDASTWPRAAHRCRSWSPSPGPRGPAARLTERAARPRTDRAAELRAA